MNRPGAFGPRTLATMTDRAVTHDLPPNSAEGQTAAPAPDKAQWLRSVEANLTKDECAFLHRAVAKMGAEQLARVMQLSPDDAARELRIEMPRPTTLTTRSP